MCFFVQLVKMRCHFLQLTAQNIVSLILIFLEIGFEYNYIVLLNNSKNLKLSAVFRIKRWHKIRLNRGFSANVNNYSRKLKKAFFYIAENTHHKESVAICFRPNPTFIRHSSDIHPTYKKIQYLSGYFAFFSSQLVGNDRKMGVGIVPIPLSCLNESF